MEYEVSVEVTYKYVLFSTIEATSEDHVIEQLNDYFKNYNLSSLETEWSGFEEPCNIGDNMSIISIEEC